MPLIIDGNRVPPRWIERTITDRVVSIDKPRSSSDHVRIAFINNMPDSALEDTEQQFFELLEAASGDLPVVVKLFSLPGVPRADRGVRHLDSFYTDTSELLNSEFDAVIMTGTEPQHLNLTQEPYWAALVNVLEWAEENTVSTILSCLAAHAGVLYSDGIERHRLDDKRFGVFEFSNSGEHRMMVGTSDVVRFPHSRWNEVRADDLRACGYAVLTESTEAGVDCFVKKKKKSFFVHFQGHPEYSGETLLREYRRDVKRFLRKERATYPSMPAEYFNNHSVTLLTAFQQIAGSDRREEMIESFPEAMLIGSLKKTWQSSATTMYGNWLRYLLSNKGSVSKFPAGALISEKFHSTSREAAGRR